MIDELKPSGLSYGCAICDHCTKREKLYFLLIFKEFKKLKFPFWESFSEKKIKSQRK